MKNKIINIILSMILLLLLIGIVKEEISYKRNERFEWTSDLDVVDSTNTIRVIDGFLLSSNIEHDIINHENRDKILYSGLHQITDYHNNELLPDTLKIKWFSYKDDAFYQINKPISFNKIKDLMNNEEKKNVEINLLFKDKGSVDLLVKCNYSRKTIFIKSFKAIKVDHKWEFSKNRNRDIFLMNSKIVFNPSIEINSDSKFKNCTSHFFNEYQFNYDSISNGKLYHYSLRESKPFKSVSFELENKKFEYGKIYVDLYFSKDEIYSCLNKMSNSPKKLEVKLDEKDSVKSVFLSDSEKRFQLKELKNYD